MCYIYIDGGFMNDKDRVYGIDILRIIAVMLVVIFHFFYNTYYYENVDLNNWNMRIQTIIRDFAAICVPLFMMITGFLNKKEKYDKSFFKSLFNILIVWFFYSLIEYFVITILNNNHQALNFKNLLFIITSFAGCEYSWYIEMYIGLYLFSPILNNAYNSFDKKNRLYSVLVILIVIILPGFINSLFDKIIHIPSWWTSIYPIAYYITGKYIADSNPKVKKKTLILILLLVQIITFSFNYNFKIEHYSITTFTSTILMFLIFYDIKLENNITKKIIKYISNITLDIYLGSSLIENIVYPIFNNKITSILGQNQILIYMPMMFVIVLILSIVYGSIRKLIINVR